MKFPLLLAGIVLSLSTITCAQDRYILVGSGGGFAGAATVYKITEKGKVFKGKGIGEPSFTECSKIKSKKVKNFFGRTSFQIVSSGEFNYPGNLYYFISMTDRGSETRRTWGDNDHPAPKSLKDLYQEILDEVSTLKYKPVE